MNITYFDICKWDIDLKVIRKSQFVCVLLSPTTAVVLNLLKLILAGWIERSIIFTTY